MRVQWTYLLKNQFWVDLVARIQTTKSAHHLLTTFKIEKYMILGNKLIDSNDKECSPHGHHFQNLRFECCLEYLSGCAT